MSHEDTHYEMDQLLQLTVDEGASDLHITVGMPPKLRIHGELQPLDLPDLTPEDTERLVKSITSPENQQKLQEHGGADFGFAFGDQARFRVSVLKTKGHYATVLRQIPNQMLPLDKIGLPAQIKDLLYKPRGLVLVTGPTGSGKTTTLASMLNYINTERGVHIITVEDPIEYYHTHKKSIITQREIGADVPTFAEALRRALRQDPDVILVGEMRDLETMQAAITAAETGHLVFATLHTTGAATTVDRIVDAFPTDQQEQVRMQLSVGLVAVISQLLLPRCDKPGRVAAFEFMVNTPGIAAMIRDSNTHQITSSIQTGKKEGMQTLDSHLLSLHLAGRISYDMMYDMSRDKDTQIAMLKERTGMM